MTSPDRAAPHGRDETGKPLAPLGYKVDGTPRVSNRGARAGQRGQSNASSKKSTAPTASLSSLTDIQRKAMLCDLADGILIAPIAGLSQVPWIAQRIGRTQTDALAGDAFILAQYMPHIADGAILLSKTKPATLAWLDKLEQNAPYILLTQALLGLGKAVAENHMRPNPQLATAGRNLAAVKLAQMAEAVNAEADRISAEAMERAAYDRANHSEPTVQFAAA